MPRKDIWVPWYREGNYKGNLSEENKQTLDNIRSAGKHPATRFEALPNDVQSYVNRIELELYDLKQDHAVGKAFAFSGISVALIYLAFKGLTYSAIVGYLSGIIIIIFAWLRYRSEWKMNAEKLLPKSKGAPTMTDQGIQMEWELAHIVHLRLQEEESDL